ncbi:hypothetical protein HZB89_01440 [archaeon]|nr:hypothetical protein [archaeon]
MGENNLKNVLVLGLSAALLLMLAFNFLTINGINGRLSALSLNAPAGGSQQAGANSAASAASLAASSDIASKLSFTGIPAVYGSELGVSYDKVVESLDVLSKLDGDLYPDGKLKFSQLSDSAKARYISMGSQIACEYCCGAKTLIAANGKPACSCAHSAAMRGIAKWLLINKPELSDAEILAEMGIWKSKFFPGKVLERAAALQANGIEVNVTNATISKYIGLKASGASGNSSEMVGGC